MEQTDISGTFSTNLKEQMRRRGLGMAQLSRKAGLNETAVYDILKQRTESPRLNTIAKIAGALEISAADLLKPSRAEGMGRKLPPAGGFSSCAADRIKWHRSLEGLTQEQYAARIGLKRAALNNWESGEFRLSLDGAIAIRDAFGLSLDFLYFGEDGGLAEGLREAWRSWRDGAGAQVERKDMARRLARARIAAGMSMVDFANSIGIAKSNYSQVEQGKRMLTVDQLYRCWRVHGISIHHLLGGEE
ncbi:MAG: helix-turn-helix domain-containing protein [Rhodobacteraceae bacterium]|nr:helix-turn-helix domain-containing protein [Paracoccaceae bacterium]MBR9823053.1 helix-turn-helix domain-containing protein [Paracoccaceae bacterium]